MNLRTYLLIKQAADDAASDKPSVGERISNGAKSVGRGAKHLGYTALGRGAAGVDLALGRLNGSTPERTIGKGRQYGGAAAIAGGGALGSAGGTLAALALADKLGLDAENDSTAARIGRYGLAGLGALGGGVGGASLGAIGASYLIPGSGLGMGPVGRGMNQDIGAFTQKVLKEKGLRALMNGELDTSAGHRLSAMGVGRLIGKAKYDNEANNLRQHYARLWKDTEAGPRWTGEGRSIARSKYDRDMQNLADRFAPERSTLYQPWLD